MPQVYANLSPTDRQNLQVGFLNYVRERDGEHDLAKEWLSHREDYFRQIDQQPVRSRRQIDADKFRRNLLTTKIDADLDPVMLWLLATVKANRSELYGIQIGKRTRLGGDKGSRNEPLIYLTLEEFYHTRVLLDAVKVFGLNVKIEPPVSRLTRYSIQGMVYLPESVSAPLVLAGEVLGVVAFTLLRNKATELFADEPEVLNRVQSLYNEILVDEIGHVAFARANAGKLGLKVAEIIQPLIARAILREVPEMDRLFGLPTLLREIARIDEYMQGNNLPVKPYRFTPGATPAVSFAGH